jgi:hypothetical protein
MSLLMNPTVAPRVSRLRPRTRLDSDGDPVESWDTPDRLVLKSATVQAFQSVEKTDPVSAAVLRDTATLYAPGEVDIAATDRVEVVRSGVAELWTVSGEPTVLVGLASGTITVARLSRQSSERRTAA